MNKKNVENIYSLSPQQQGMLVECLAAFKAGVQGIHIEQFTCTLQGQVDLQIFKRAWQYVAGLHSVLRTALVWKDQDEPYQVVLRQVEVPFEHQDWRGLAPDDQQARLQAYLAADRQRGFELGTAPLIRVATFQTADSAYRLVWTFHHILLDGWCQPLVLNQVFFTYLALCKGQDLVLKPSRPYRDYIAWLKKRDLADTRRYWQETLRDFTQPVPLGKEADLASPVAPQELYGSQAVRLPAELTQQLQAYAKQQHLTLNTLVQGAWTLLLSRYSGQADVVFGVTVSGRPAELPDVESMVGLFISTLPLRLKVPRSMALAPWLQEVQRRHLALQQHGYCSVGQVRQWSQVPGRLPLYESLLVFENYPVEVSERPLVDSEIQISQLQTLGAQTNYALTFLVTAGRELQIRLVYHRQRIEGGSIPRILEHFAGVVEAIALNPEQPLETLLDQIPLDQIPKVKSFWQAGTQADLPAFVAPRTSTEATLARIWAEVLGLERVGIQHSFFELGGYSLLAIEIMSRVREVFQIELPLRLLFEAPTIADLAIVIAQKQAEQADSETLERLLTELEDTAAQPTQALDEPAASGG